MPKLTPARRRRVSVESCVNSRPSITPFIELLESRMLRSGSPEAVWSNVNPSGSGVERLPQLVTSYNSQGLSKLTYNGWTYYDASRTESFKPTLYNWNLLKNGVEQRNVFASNQVTQYNAATKTIDAGVPWSDVFIKYSASTTALNVTVTVTNTARDGTIIEGFNLLLASLVFPQTPNFDANQQMVFNYEQPGVVVAQDQKSSVAIAMQTVRQRIGVGYLSWGYITQHDNEYPIRIGTAELAGESGAWPVYNSDIYPGQQQVYQLSIRFAPGHLNAETIAPDVFASYAAADPSIVTWTDKRPIGQVALFNNGVPTSNVDLNAPNAIATFRTVALAFADTTIAALKASDAQGAIFWDMEGESQPRATYVGDPRETAIMTPAMDDVADDFYKKFTDAGLRIGMTIRPTQVEWDSQGAYQAPVADPAAELEAKVDYCKARWGATMFYVDSASFFNPDWIEPVAKANPDCLFVVENPSPAIYAVGAGYLDMRTASQPSLAAQTLYPSAFSTEAVGDGPGPSSTDVVSDNVRATDIVLYHGAAVIPTQYANDIGAKKLIITPPLFKPEPPLNLFS